MIRKLASVLVILAAACSQEAEQTARSVETSGKTDVEISRVPPKVLAAANAHRPGFTAQKAERETRDGRRYYDIEGKLADGSEIEFDIMKADGRWQVVETQRDIALDVAPAQIRDAVQAADAKFTPTRVIESTQQDGIVIYELFGPKGSDPQGRKIEVKYDGRAATVLTEEWAH